MKKLLFIPILLCAVATSGFAQSVIPQTMSFQGYVTQSDTAFTDTSGGTIVDLALFDDPVAGNQVWSQVGQTVKVFRSYYTANLDLHTGAGTHWVAGVVPWSKPYWLQAIVKGDSLNPRVQLTTAAYSFVADTALHVASSVPIGTIEAYGIDISKLNDPNWLPCDGREVWDSTYPTFAALVGTTYGETGTDSVYLPDLRGLFLRGVNQINSRNRTDTLADPDFNNRQAMNHNGTGNTNNSVGSIQMDENRTDSLNVILAAPYTGGQQGATNDVLSQTTPDPNVPSPGNGYNSLNRGGKESRPKNAYVYWIIKVK